MTWVNVGDRHAAPLSKSPTAYVLMRECNCILAGLSACVSDIELAWEDEGWWRGPIGLNQRGTGKRMDRPGLRLSRREACFELIRVCGDQND